MCVALFVFVHTSHAVSAQRTEVDVPYVPSAAYKQQLDLYLPADGGFPTVLFVHGGSLASGDRKDEPWVELCRTFARSGIGCAALSYRLFPSVLWPKPAEDVASAFAWLRNNIAERGGDPTRVALLGHSAGCLLATLVGTDGRFLQAHGMSTKDILGVIAMGCRLAQPIADSASIVQQRAQRVFRTDPVASRFGRVDALARYRPISHVGPHLPPFLVVVAEDAGAKPRALADAASFVTAARECRVDADLEVVANRPMRAAFERLADASDPAFRRIRAFIDRLSAERRISRVVGPTSCTVPPS